MARTRAPKGPSGSRGRWLIGPTRAMSRVSTGSRVATSVIAAWSDVRATARAPVGGAPGRGRRGRRALGRLLRAAALVVAVPGELFRRRVRRGAREDRDWSPGYAPRTVAPAGR